MPNSTKPIYITLNFFAKDWENDAKAELWACLQPHVLESDLLYWVNNFNDSKKFNYNIPESADKKLHNALNLQAVPVNFPNNADLKFTLKGTSQPNESYIIRRTTRMVIQPGTGETITVENTGNETTADSEQKFKHLENGAFAGQFNEYLKKSYQDMKNKFGKDAGLQQLNYHLMLCFWGGRTRIIPKDTCKPLDNHLMKLPPEAGPDLFTNIHSLCGLMINLGSKSNIEAHAKEIAKQKTAILEINAAGQSYSINVPEKIIEEYFILLENADLSNSEIKAKLLPGCPEPAGDTTESRVYVNPNDVAFKYYRQLLPQKTEITDRSLHWYRRRRDSNEAVEPLTLKQLSKMLVFFHKEGSSTQNSVPPKFITWKLFDSFEVEFSPYRKFPAKYDEQHGYEPGTLFQLRLNNADAKRFYKILANVDSSNDYEFENIRLFSEKGDEITSSFHSLDGQAKLSYYQLPWDIRGGNTYTAVCIYQPDSQNPLKGTSIKATLLVPLKETIKVEHKGAFLSKDEDDQGERWEYIPQSTLPPITADVLQIAQPETDPSVPDSVYKNLIPSMRFKGDETFAFAQSASNIEGFAKLEYPTPNSSKGAFVEEYERDLSSYKSLTISSSWEDLEEKRILNSSELLAVGPIKEIKHNHYVLQFRFSLDPKDRVNWDKSKSQEDLGRMLIRENEMPGKRLEYASHYYQKLYHSMQHKRSLLDWEPAHTYGVKWPKFYATDTTAPKLSAHADFPVALPMEVTLLTKENENNVNSNEVFLTVEYVCSNDGTETAVLQFRTEWLSKDFYNYDPKLFSVHAAAWRSLAELNAAKAVFLEGQFLSFDLETALKISKDSPRHDALIKAFKTAKRFENINWDITTVVKDFCKQWFDDGKGDSQIEVVLTVNGSSDKKRIYEVCNIIEFHLNVNRGEKIQPAKNQWRLMKPKKLARSESPFPDYKDGCGQVFEELKKNEHPVTFKSFEAWLKLLRQRTGIIRPSDKMRHAFVNKVLERMLGTESDGLSHGWIAPEGIVTGGDRKCAASACPLAFRPMKHKEDEAFSQETMFTVLSRYFKALEVVLDCNILKWQNNNGQKWKEYFENLSNPVVISEFGLLFQNMEKLIWPLPDLEWVKNQPEVKVIVEQFQNDKLQRDVFSQWLISHLYEKPSIFASSKAFLFQRLNSGAEQIPELFQLQSKKVIRETERSHQSTENSSKNRNAIIDNDSFSYRDFLNNSESNWSEWLGVADILDNATYDNEFHFEGFNLEPFERMLEHQMDNENDQWLESSEIIYSGRPRSIRLHFALPVPEGQRIFGSYRQKGGSNDGNLINVEFEKGDGVKVDFEIVLQSDTQPGSIKIKTGDYMGWDDGNGKIVTSINPNTNKAEPVPPIQLKDGLQLPNGKQQFFFAKIHMEATNQGRTTFKCQGTLKPIRKYTLTLSAGNITGTDKPSKNKLNEGSISGIGIKSGEVNYKTGMISVTFDEPQSKSTAVIARYEEQLSETLEPIDAEYLQYKATLTENPVQQGSIQILVNDIIVGEDNLGKIEGDSIESGHINYQNGTLHVNFKKRPRTNDPIRAEYRQVTIVRLISREPVVTPQRLLTREINQFQHSNWIDDLDIDADVFSIKNLKKGQLSTAGTKKVDLGAGDGFNRLFEAQLGEGIGKKSLALYIDDDILARDNGNGKIEHDDIHRGRIDYDTGELYLKMKKTVPRDAPVAVSFYQVKEVVDEICNAIEKEEDVYDVALANSGIENKSFSVQLTRFPYSTGKDEKGDGNIEGLGFKKGSRIDYHTGKLCLVLSSPIPQLKTVRVKYRHLPTEDKQLKIVSHTPLFTRSNKLDRAVLSAMFKIVGDEEGNNSFANDKFHFDLKIFQQRLEEIATGNGSTNDYEFTLTHLPVNPGSVIVTAGSMVAKDKDGKLEGDATGSIDYKTGETKIHFKNAVPVDKKVIAKYMQLPNSSKKVPDTNIKTTSRVKNVFNDLNTNVFPESMNEPQNIIDPKVLDFVRKTLVPADPLTAENLKEPHFKIEDQQLICMDNKIVELGIGDGSKLRFAVTLQSPPILPKTLFITAGKIRGSDDGKGKISGQGIQNGSVDYKMTSIEVIFNTPPANGVRVTATYNYICKRTRKLPKNAGGRYTKDHINSLIDNLPEYDKESLIFKIDNHLSVPKTELATLLDLCLPDDNIWVEFRTESPQTHKIEGVLLREFSGDNHCNNNANTQINTDTFLIINIELPVWDQYSMGLIQTRNIREDIDVSFGRVSQRLSDSRPYQIIINREWQQAPITIQRKKYSISNLAAIALNAYMDETKWKEHDISILSMQVQETRVPSFSLDFGNSHVLQYQSEWDSVMPEHNVLTHQQGDLGEEYSWFPEPYKEFSVDFNWSNKNTNLPFFSIKGVRFNIS